MSPTVLRSFRDIILLTLAGLLLLFAQSAYWLNHTIFNEQNFTSIVNPVITSEESRRAIATTIVNTALEDKPVINRLIGGNVTDLVTGLLGTNFAQEITTTIIDKSYNYLTSDNPKPIAIDLTVIKVPLEKITQILSLQGNETLSASAIPDSIVLLDPSGLPDIYGYSIIVLWLGPLCWIGALLLGVLYIYVGRKKYAQRVYILGSVVIVVACIGLLVGPLLPPPIVAQVPIPALRGVVEQLIAGLLAPFTQQMIIMLVITAVALVIFSLRFAMLRGVQWLVHKTANAVSKDKGTKVTKDTEEPKSKATKTTAKSEAVTAKPEKKKSTKTKAKKPRAKKANK